MASDRDLLDVDYLGRQTAGDEDLERDLLDLFLGQCALLLPQLLQIGDLRTRREAAHSLRGAAAALGANRISALAAAIEEAALAGDAPSGVVLETAIAETREAVRRHLSARAA